MTGERGVFKERRWSRSSWWDKSHIHCDGSVILHIIYIPGHLLRLPCSQMRYFPEVQTKKDLVNCIVTFWKSVIFPERNPHGWVTAIHLKTVRLKTSQFSKFTLSLQFKSWTFKFWSLQVHPSANSTHWMKSYSTCDHRTCSSTGRTWKLVKRLDKVCEYRKYRTLLLF